MFSKQFLDERPQLSSFLEYWKINSFRIYVIFILLASFFTFFVIGRQDPTKEKPCIPEIGISCIFGTYTSPSSLFWDENYHVASANRYIRGEYFMEYHPPLGKLIIALGEKIFNQNANLDTSFVSGFTEKSCVDNTCYAKDACPKEKKCTIEKSIGNDQDSIPYLPSMDVKYKDGYINQTGEAAKFNFAGVRFFPILFAWMCAILIFYLIFLITKNQHVAFVFSLGYVFDNAIIVHSRGAMLDGIQLFFVISALVFAVKAFKTGLFKIYHYIILGLLIGLAVATKLNGLILAPIVLLLTLKEFYTINSETKLYVAAIFRKFISLFAISFVFNFIVSKFLLVFKSVKDVTDPAVLEQIGIINGQRSLFFGTFTLISTFVIFYYGNNLLNKYYSGYFDSISKVSRENWNKFLDFCVAVLGKIAAFSLALVFVFGFVFFIHFNISTKVIGNNNFAKFTSDTTKSAIASGETGNILNFFSQLKDSLYYISESQKGVPSWDPTKGDNEAGSLPITWPIGNHAIRYYASAYSKCDVIIKDQPCQNIRYTSYLYLVANITVWLIVLLGVILSLVLIISKFVFGNKEIADNLGDIENKESFWWITFFAGLYVAYMISVMQIERVMYLYHYFLPLIFGLVGSAVLFDYYFKNKNKLFMVVILILMSILIFANFVYFAPFSYNFDFTEETFEARRWLKYWGLFYYKQ